MKALENFKLQPFLDAANELVRADEVKRAIWILDNLPGFYRDHPPEEVIQLKNEILQRIALPQHYQFGECTLVDKEEQFMMLKKILRSALLLETVIELNKINIEPQVVDYGPGDFWVPALLKRENCKFTYRPITVQLPAALYAKQKIDWEEPKDTDSFRLFFAGEIIEHLWEESDLKTTMLSAGSNLADICQISTPRYSFDTRDFEWRTHRELLGHMRTYTPDEFQNVVRKLFPEYEWFFLDGQVMQINLIKKGSSKEVTEAFLKAIQRIMIRAKEENHVRII